MDAQCRIHDRILIFSLDLKHAPAGGMVRAHCHDGKDPGLGRPCDGLIQVLDIFQVRMSVE